MICLKSCKSLVVFSLYCTLVLYSLRCMCNWCVCPCILYKRLNFFFFFFFFSTGRQLDKLQLHWRSAPHYSPIFVLCALLFSFVCIVEKWSLESWILHQGVNRRFITTFLHDQMLHNNILLQTTFECAAWRHTAYPLVHVMRIYRLFKCD